MEGPVKAVGEKTHEWSYPALDFASHNANLPGIYSSMTIYFLIGSEKCSMRQGVG